MPTVFWVEAAIVAGVLSTSVWTLVLVYDPATARAWIMPLFIASVVGGGFGLVMRAKGRGRLAGLGYLVTALSPNGLYLLNALMLGVSLAAMANLKLDRTQPGKANRATHT